MSDATATNIANLNAMNRDLFVAALGGIFEHSPWIAEDAWEARPFADLATLHAAMVRAMRAGSEAKKLALLRAHPELAGREAREGRLTGDSVGEQQSAGLDQLEGLEVRQLGELNAAYRAKFGFPFIIAVRARTKHEIFSEFARRLRRTVVQEHEAALAEVETIARIRLERLFGLPQEESGGLGGLREVRSAFGIG
jgi:2-oxo-4-hydroxy-4-carboxy-5-ureidoimidazoline decarboxylase